MHRSLARYSAPVSFVQAPSWADFITTMVGFEVFATHKGRRSRDFAPPNPEAAPMQHRLLPARVYGPRQGFRAIDGSSKVEKAGSRPPRAGIARAQTFYRYFAERILLPLPNGVFRSSSWSAPHRAWSSNARSIRWGTVRISCRSSISGESASPEIMFWVASAGG